jgi:hypothetical protein
VTRRPVRAVVNEVSLRGAHRRYELRTQSWRMNDQSQEKDSAFALAGASHFNQRATSDSGGIRKSERVARLRTRRRPAVRKRVAALVVQMARQSRLRIGRITEAVKAFRHNYSDQTAENALRRFGIAEPTPTDALIMESVPAKSSYRCRIWQVP